MVLRSSLLVLLAICQCGSAVELSRRLQDDQNDEANDDGAVANDYRYDFLRHYEQVYLTCHSNIELQDAQGNNEYGAVVYRLCPYASSCENQKVCNSGYGDYVVGLKTYMKSFVQQFQKGQDEDGNNNNDQGFYLADLAQCGQIDVDGGDEDMAYYVGPTCSNGKIRLALFASYEGDADACKPENESTDVTFYELTGFDLPWSTSFVGNKCDAFDCYADKGQYNEFCTTLYASATKKCETKMQYQPSDSEQSSNDDCSEISSMLPRSSMGGSRAGWVIVAFVALVVVGAAIWYYFRQNKRVLIDQEKLML